MTKLFLGEPAMCETRVVLVSCVIRLRKRVSLVLGWFRGRASITNTANSITARLHNRSFRSNITICCNLLQFKKYFPKIVPLLGKICRLKTLSSILVMKIGC